MTHVTAPERKRSSFSSPWWRRIRLLVAGVATVTALLVGLLFMPAVQGWLVRQYVASHAGWRIQYDALRVGPSGMEIRGLDFSTPGVRVRAATITTRIAPSRLFNQRELHIEHANAQSLTVTLTPADFPVNNAPSARTFTGVTRLLQSPLAWALDDAHLDGEIVLWQGDESIITGTFQLNGGGVTSTQTGAFTYELTVSPSVGPASAKDGLRSGGVIRLAQGQKHGAERISIEADVTLPRFGALVLPTGKFTGSVTATSSGEDYRTVLGFGTAASLELSGAFDAAVSVLTGSLVVHANQSLLANLAADKRPTIALNTTADFVLDARRSDFSVTLAGMLDASAWARLAPELSVLDAFKGKLDALITRRNGTLSLERFIASLEGANTPATLHLELTRPIDPTALPAIPIGSVSMAHWPLQWLNPWLAANDIVIDAVEFGGAWKFAIGSDQVLQLVPTRACKLGPVAVHGAGLPPLPSLHLSFSPQMELSLARAVLMIDDFAATIAEGDRIGAKFSATYDLKTKTSRSEGEASGTIRTLLSGAEQPFPFDVNARWNVRQTGTQLEARTLEVTARKDATSPPYLALQLLQPLTVDFVQFTVLASTATPDWIRLKFDRLPLGWVSRWLQHRQIGGFLAEGESVLRSGADGQLAFVTTTPWKLSDASFALGGQTLYHGDLRVTPSFVRHPGHTTAQLADIQGTDTLGNRVTGLLSVEAQLTDRKAAATLALDFELPALRHSAGTYGALHASLRATSHNESPTVMVVDTFALRVRNQQRDLVAVEAPEPFLLQLPTAGILAVGMLSPLRLKVGEIPLEWTRPWITGVELAGTLQPTEFELSAQLTKFLLRPLKPVTVRGFAARIGDREMARQMDFTVSPGLDLTLICIPLPTFQLGYSGTARLSQGAIDVDGRRAIDVDAALSFVGNGKTTLPSGIEFTTRADFAELNRIPALARRGLPIRGTFVAQLTGDTRSHTPLELWSRIDGLPDMHGSRTLPALEVFAHGRILPDATVTAGVDVRFATFPIASDAKFDVKLNMRAGNLEIASALRSNFLDVMDVRALAEAFRPKSNRAETPLANDGTARRSFQKNATYLQSGTPFWEPLRGHFNLDMAAVEYAPYRIDHLRGQLDLRERELVLSNLTGEMFAGDWSGEVKVDYQPENKNADHALVGGFRIKQFDSARVVQTVFPKELASLDAQIDLDSTLRSQGNALLELIDRTAAEFTVDGRGGVVRLTVPKQDMAATAVVFGGAVLLSPELRALGRLMKKFAEMPIDQLRITGERNAAGDVSLKNFRLDSPQALFVAKGNILADEGQPLMNRPLQLSIDLAARDEMAVILGGMNLIEKKPRADGYRALKETFVLGGKAGAPDTRPLYDLFAKAVVGSKGTWGFLMRKIQGQLDKVKPDDAKKIPTINRAAAIP